MLRFENKEYAIENGESVLDCLLRHGEQVSSLCRTGACQSCLLQATSGSVPAAAQQGLKDAWKQQGYFMACVCRPQADLAMQRCDAAASHESRVEAVTEL